MFRLGQRFADELDGDRVVVGCAALTHDLHRVLGDGTGCDPEETLGDVATVLTTAGVGDARIDAVQHCVAVHDDLECRGEEPQPRTLEAEMLRDADNLDALGAIGIARTVTYRGAHGMGPWDPDGEVYSPIYHFEEKLLRLHAELHTAPARALGAQRHERLEAFYEQFLAEWHGET